MTNINNKSVRQKWMTLWIKSKKERKNNRFLATPAKNNNGELMLLSPTSIDSSTRESEYHDVLNDHHHLDTILNDLPPPKLDGPEALDGTHVNEDDNAKALESSEDDSDTKKYGYGEAIPDSEKERTFCIPTSIRDTNNSNTVAKETSRFDLLHRSASQRVLPKRSSMKKIGSPPKRRASIQLCGEMDDNGRPLLKRQTSIKFNNVLKVRPVVPAKALLKDNEGPQQLWFQPKDFSEIKKSCFAIVDRVDQGTSKNYCTRGLERYFAHARRESIERRHSAWDSVLDLQDTIDDEQMARVYKLSTLANQRDAVDRAKQDEREIEKYLESTRRESSAASYRNMLLEKQQSLELLI